LLFAAFPEFSRATANCFDPLEQQAARVRARSVVQAVAPAFGKQHYIFNTQQAQQDQGQQQQLVLCPATQQGLKHWAQASQAAAADDIWCDLWAGSTAALEEVLSRAFAAGFGSSLELTMVARASSPAGASVL
jgi:hypothetical protein